MEIDSLDEELGPLSMFWDRDREGPAPRPPLASRSLSLELFEPIDDDIVV